MNTFSIAKNCIFCLLWEHTLDKVNAMANAGHGSQDFKPDPSTNLVTWATLLSQLEWPIFVYKVMSS